ADRRKNKYQKVSFDFKLSVIDELHNGPISINHASKVYGISRSSITYWMKKLSSFIQTKKGMSKYDKIKKLKERFEAIKKRRDWYVN
ncbi:MAG: helix-turn-helix domain-containing protein, partial [Chitinophagaceae bacterium]